MKILIVTGVYPPDIGGPASYSRALARKLAEDHDVTIVTYSSSWSTRDDSQEKFRIIRVWKKWPWFIRNAFYGIKVFFRARHHDRLFVLSTVNGGIPAMVSGRFWKKRVFVRIPGDFAWQVAVEKGKSSLLIDDFQKAVKKGWPKFLSDLQSKICRSADGVIVPSEYLASIVRGWGVPPERITVIYNGVEFKPSGLGKEDARRKLGITGNIILSAGRLAPWKGFRMLIKIMPQLATINQFFKLIIVGDGPDEGTLRSIIKNLGLDRKVVLAGRKSQEELAEFLAAADMFVLNTGYEGFSHQILEAMKAGIPVITTSVGGNPEIMRQGENGLMVKYNDEFNLIEAIKSVWQMEDLRNQFVSEGKKSIKKFSVEKMYDQTISYLTK